MGGSGPQSDPKELSCGKHHIKNQLDPLNHNAPTLHTKTQSIAQAICKALPAETERSAAAYDRWPERNS